MADGGVVQKAIMIDAFLILLNEEELLQYALESFESFVDLLGVVSIVDNGSTDDSLDIVQSFQTRLPIVLQRETSHAHHGALRSLAISKCKSPWIFYLDADETCSRNMRDWMASGAMEDADIYDFYKFTSIVDRYHYVEGGNGPCTRLFRNLEGVYFPQNVHTEPTHPGLTRKRMANSVYLWDATACKSLEGLWAKGWRYKQHAGTVGIGPEWEYVGRVSNAHKLGLVREHDEKMKSLIFCGPL